jgi:hypothetical protein
MIRRERQPKQLEKASMAYCWWAANKNVGRGATRELIFRSIYYKLNIVVNLVKCGVFILLVVVMCYFGLRQSYIKN